MRKRVVCIAIGCAIIAGLSLVSCSSSTVSNSPSMTTTSPHPATTQASPATSKPTGEVPQYGGTLNLVLTTDVSSFGLLNTTFQPGQTFARTNETLWEGDWTKGPAGGYGSDENDWMMSTDLFSQKSGNTVQSWKWTVDSSNDEGTIVYEVRQGVHFALNPESDASKLVNGREVTADDIVYALKLLTTNNKAYIYNSDPELRNVDITKSGPWEVTVKVPLDAMMTALSRFGYWGYAIPPEVMSKYGDMHDWHNSVGSGPFMLTDYVSGSEAVMKRNSNYWRKDPIGPGRGNQLPYINGLNYLIITDASTRLAALRTGKIDDIYPITWEDAATLQKGTPDLKSVEEPMYGSIEVHMRVDQPPFNDLRVRQALLMATDLESIKNGYNGGLGVTQTWPWPYDKAYADAYLSLDDPTMPESVKELYQYNPDKAKQLLSEAGYPDGFKTTALITQTEVDYFSILKNMWSKVGIDLSLDVVDPGVKAGMLAAKKQPAISDFGLSQAVMYYLGSNFSGTGIGNVGMIDDPKINDALKQIRETAITKGEPAAMTMWKGLMPYFLGQAYAIPTPEAPVYNFWWPWIKNYSGEIQLGYGLGSYNNWAKYIWIDQSLKQQMGY